MAATSADIPHAPPGTVVGAITSRSGTHPKSSSGQL